MVKKPLFTVTDRQRKNYERGSISDFVLLYNTKVLNEFERIKLTYKDQSYTAKGFQTSEKMMKEEADWNIQFISVTLLVSQ